MTFSPSCVIQDSRCQQGLEICAEDFISHYPDPKSFCLLALPLFFWSVLQTVCVVHEGVCVTVWFGQ